MEVRDEELIRSLVPSNADLRSAIEEHTRLNALVDQMGAKSFLSPEQQIKKKDLKKRKLVEKDKIMRILADHRRIGS